jgi:hypothetical protein
VACGRFGESALSGSLTDCAGMAMKQFTRGHSHLTPASTPSSSLTNRLVAPGNE